LDDICVGWEGLLYPEFDTQIVCVVRELLEFGERILAEHKGELPSKTHGRGIIIPEIQFSTLQ